MIVLLTDDQGYGDLSSHGNPELKTPNLDKLWGESTRFTDFHVAPMCTPTRSQLLTGRHCLTNLAMNVSSGRTMLRRDLPTMPEIFAKAGYATGHFGKWHLGDNYPYRPQDRGFEETVWFPSSHIGSAGDFWNNDYYNDTYRTVKGERKFSGYCTDVFFQQAMEFMRGASARKQPFFVYLPTNAPHGPLFVPEEYTRPYKHLPQNVARFFGMIANLDENVGKLDAYLARAGIQDDTIFIYMTDNGATAGLRVHNAGMRGGKITLWDGGHRVPCFVRWAKGGVAAKRDVTELTQAQDVLPTLIDLCKLEAPKGSVFDGASLAPVLQGRGNAPKDRPMVVQFSRMNIGMPQWGDATVMWNKWRLVSMTELYDVARDPAQKNNLAAQHADVAGFLRAQYEQFWRANEPRFRSYLAVHIGSDAEPESLLCPTDWADSFLDQAAQIRAANRINGVWHVNAERGGEYEFSLSRWPRALRVAMQAGVPAHKGECGEYPAGVAMPVARATLKVAGREMTQAVQPGQVEANFKLAVSEGRTTVQTWFHGPDGQELSGAYFVYAGLSARG